MKYKNSNKKETKSHSSKNRILKFNTAEKFTHLPGSRLNSEERDNEGNRSEKEQ